jgi:hypothetical protein
MHSPLAPTLTRASILHVEIEYRGQMGEAEVHPRDLANAVSNLGWLCRVAYAIGMPKETFSLEAIEKNQWLEPRIVRLQFGSPFEAITEIASPILASATAMSAVIYSLKRLWKLPVEFRTHERLMEARFIEAEAKALEAEIRKSEIEREYEDLLGQQVAKRQRDLEQAGGSDLGTWREQYDEMRQRSAEDFRSAQAKKVEALDALDVDIQWPAGTMRRLDSRIEHGWQGKSALWLAEHDDESDSG